MLRPIVDFAIARGVKFQDFVEIAKRGFVQGAERQLIREGKEVSHSRIAIMTGIQRPEVKRVLAREVKTEPKDLVARLLGQWQHDRRFLDGRKKPKRLRIKGNQSEFARLVCLVSKDLNPHTVRFELERLGLIKVRDGMAALERAVFITSGDPEQTIRFGAEDASDLLRAVGDNAFLSNKTPHLHARTQYDNIPDEYVPQIREWLLDLGGQFHAECRQFLSSFDRDINPKSARSEGRNRVVVGTFSLSHELRDKDSCGEDS